TAVELSRARLEQESASLDALHDVCGVKRQRFVRRLRHPMRDARRVLPQLFDRRFSPAGATWEPRKVLLDGCLGVQPMLLDEKENERIGHRLRNRGDSETRLFAIRNAQLPAGKAIGSPEDRPIAPLDEKGAAEEIGARLWLDQPRDLVGCR